MNDIPELTYTVSQMQWPPYFPNLNCTQCVTHIEKVIANHPSNHKPYGILQMSLSINETRKSDYLNAFEGFRAQVV